jgi:hypothetical protein
VTIFDFPPFRWPHSVFEEGACLVQRFLVAGTHPSRTWASWSFKSVYDRMRVTQTRPRFNVPSERREHHQPQVIGHLIQEKISLPLPGLEPGSPALESSVLTTPPLARSSLDLIIAISVECLLKRSVDTCSLYFLLLLCVCVCVCVCAHSCAWMC